MDTVPENRLAAFVRRLPTARRRPAIPLADLDGLHRPLLRTTAVRLGLLAALLVLAAVAIWRAARLEVRALSFLPRDTTTILVLDQSKSVYLSGYQDIAALFRSFADDDAPIGLVTFSDIAYELLPPGTHGVELRSFVRFYTPSKGGANALDTGPRFPRTPWDSSFSGGTKISEALGLARHLLRRDHVRRGTILLISDLDTADTDLPALAGSLTELRRSALVDLRVFPLHPDSGPLRFFQQFLGKGAFVSSASVALNRHVETRQRFEAASPTWLVIPAFLLLAALAANEFFCGRIELGRPQEAPA